MSWRESVDSDFGCGRDSTGALRGVEGMGESGDSDFVLDLCTADETDGVRGDCSFAGLAAGPAAGETDWAIVGGMGPVGGGREWRRILPIPCAAPKSTEVVRNRNGA